MKKMLFIFLALMPLTITSCATAITEGKMVEEYQIRTSFDNPKMDFIGYKIDTNILSTSAGTKVSVGTWSANVDTVMSEFDQAKAIANTSSLRQLGFNLQNVGIANNKADTYFGIYSLQELELYKTDKKYVTFVEVAKSELDYKDNKTSRTVFGCIGAGIMGGGSGILTVGVAYQDSRYKEVRELANNYKTAGGICMGIGVPFLILALLPTKTEIRFSGLYNIYIYDTQAKALIRKDTVSVNCSETFKGSYDYDESSKAIVRDWVSKNVYNALLQKYDELNSWIVYGNTIPQSNNPISLEPQNSTPIILQQTKEPQDIAQNNLIENPNFSKKESLKDGTGWEFTQTAPAIGTITFSDNEIILTQISGGAYGGLWLVQGNISVKQNTQYILNIEAYAERNRSATINLLSKQGCLKSFQMKLTPNKQKFTYEFTTINSDNNFAVQIAYMTQSPSAPIHITNVTLVEKD